MKEQLTKALAGIKEFWQKLTPKVKRIIQVSAVAVVVGVAALTTLFYINGSQFTEIFAGMDKAEASQVYVALQDAGFAAEMDNTGKVLVPSQDYDKALFEMSVEGFPKSTLSYDPFLNTSITSTESDKIELKRMTLEQNVTRTLTQGVDGVKNAIVLLNLPVVSTHVWDNATPQEGTTSVTITMENGVELTPERVTGIKKLVSGGVPNMKPESVEVIDGSTGMAMEGISDGAAGGSFNLMRFEYERHYEKQIEDKTKRLLGPQYGADGVVVVATARFNFDKWVRETLNNMPAEFGKEDTSKGILEHQETTETKDGVGTAGGIAGQTPNTDTGVPQYGAGTEGAANGTINYSQLSDYALDYIKEQWESSEPVLEDIAVAVRLNEPALMGNSGLDQTLSAELSKALLIPATSIQVSMLNPDTIPTIDLPPAGNGFEWKPIYFVYVGAPLLLILAALIVIVVLRRRRKAKDSAASQESEQLINSLQEEIEVRKKQLAEAAQRDSNPGDGAIVTEVRQFAKENPEITANLIRSWLKEDT